MQSEEKQENKLYLPQVYEAMSVGQIEKEGGEMKTIC